LQHVGPFFIVFAESVPTVDSMFVMLRGGTYAICGIWTARATSFVLWEIARREEPFKGKEWLEIMQLTVEGDEHKEKPYDGDNAEQEYYCRTYCGVWNDTLGC